MNSIDSNFSAFSFACRANNAHQAMLANAMISFSIQHNRDLGKTGENEAIYSRRRKVEIEELIIACTTGNLETVDYLLEIGVDATINDNSPLRQASEFGHIDVAKSLIAWGATPVATFVLSNPVANGHLDMVELLIRHGAQISDGDYQVFRVAIRYDRTNIVNYLINHSLKKGLGLNMRTEYLEYSARKNSEKNMVSTE